MNQKSSAIGISKLGGDRKSYTLLVIDHDVLFSHNTDSDKEIEIPSDLFQNTHLFIAQVKTRM